MKVTSNRRCMKYPLFFLLIFSSILVKGQDLKYYRYDTDLLSKEFHQGRRQALREKMPDNSVAVLFANPERNRSNDVDFEYHQDPNFCYLTGFTEPNSMLMIFKLPQTLRGVTADEFLFVRDHNPSEELWTGRRAGKEGAKELTGVKGVFLAADFDSINIDFKKFDKILYAVPKGAVEDKFDKSDLYSMIESFKKKTSFPP